MQILSLALKDLKLLLRDRTAAFFILAFPVLMGLFFGMMMSGTSDDNRGKISIAVVDQDTTDLSRAFVKVLANNSSLAVLSEDLDAAKESVRKGSMTGMLVIPQGFHQTAGIFWEPSPELQLGVDPSRTAEGAMLEGFVMQAMSELIQHRLRNPDAFLPSIAKAREDFAASPELDPLTRQLGSAMFAALEQFIGQAKLQPATGTSETSASEIVEGGFQLARVRRLDVTTKTVPSQLAVQTAKLRSQWDISFPQAMLWGVLGCVAGFAISIARERSAGTLQRLLASPLSLQRILLGKALACFLASLFVIGLLAVRRDHDDDQRSGQDRAECGGSGLGNQPRHGNDWRLHDSRDVHAGVYPADWSAQPGTMGNRRHRRRCLAPVYLVRNGVALLDPARHWTGWVCTR